MAVHFRIATFELGVLSVLAHKKGHGHSTLRNRSQGRAVMSASSAWLESIACAMIIVVPRWSGLTH